MTYDIKLFWPRVCVRFYNSPLSYSTRDNQDKVAMGFMSKMYSSLRNCSTILDVNEFFKKAGIFVPSTNRKSVDV